MQKDCHDKANANIVQFSRRPCFHGHPFPLSRSFFVSPTTVTWAAMSFLDTNASWTLVTTWTRPADIYSVPPAPHPFGWNQGISVFLQLRDNDRRWVTDKLTSQRHKETPTERQGSCVKKIGCYSPSPIPWANSKGDIKNIMSGWFNRNGLFR